MPQPDLQSQQKISPEHQKLLDWADEEKTPNIAVDLEQDVLVKIGDQCHRGYERDLKSLDDYYRKNEQAFDLAAQIALEHPLVLGDDVEDLVQLLFRKILSAHGRIKAESFADLRGAAGADAIDVAERDLYFLVVGNVYAEDSRHGVRAVWKVGKRSELEGSGWIWKQKIYFMAGSGFQPLFR